MKQLFSVIVKSAVDTTVQSIYYLNWLGYSMDHDDETNPFWHPVHLFLPLCYEVNNMVESCFISLFIHISDKEACVLVALWPTIICLIWGESKL